MISVNVSVNLQLIVCYSDFRKCPDASSNFPYCLIKKLNRFKLFSFYSHHEKQHRYELFFAKNSPISKTGLALQEISAAFDPNDGKEWHILLGISREPKGQKKNRLSLQNLYKSYIKTETKKLFWSLWVASLCICTFHPDMGVEGFWLAGVSTQPAITCWCLLIEVDGPVHCVCGLGSFLKNV